eukprot:106260-Ditylum_brightwellii.AAC.1
MLMAMLMRRAKAFHVPCNESQVWLTCNMVKIVSMVKGKGGHTFCTFTQFLFVKMHEKRAGSYYTDMRQLVHGKRHQNEAGNI